MMEGGSTVSRVLMVASVATVLFLHPAPSVAQTSEGGESPARSQAFVFERILRGAVETGGQLLAKRALMLVPELTLSTEEATVRSVKLRGYGFYFDVQVPNIQSTVLLLDMMAARQRRGLPSQTVAATGVIESDPMTVEPPTFDTDREYTTYVREALIDAILDSSGVLSVSADERLTVVVSGIDHPNPNPLYRANSQKLVLTIAGSDLLDLRQGRLTRDQAKERIAEERF